MSTSMIDVLSSLSNNEATTVHTINKKVARQITAEIVSSSESESISNNDKQLLLEADELVTVEQYIAASERISEVTDPSILTERHRRIQSQARMAEQVIHELLQPNDGSWVKQSEMHGHRDTIIYYKVNETDASVTCRIETPIEASLLNPLLSVFNESDLFYSWMPQWRVPRLGVSKSEKLAELGRGNQMIQVVIDMPFPFADRECIQHAFAVDAIESHQAIVIKVDSLGQGTHDGNIMIGPVEPGVVRVDFDAGILIRSCPPDHPTLRKSKHKYDEKLLLISVIQRMDAHVAGVPLKLINFFTRTVLGSMWGSLLRVAEDVRNGKRPQHQEAITNKPELYDWVAQRVQVMLDQIDTVHSKNESYTLSKTQATEK